MLGENRVDKDANRRSAFAQPRISVVRKCPELSRSPIKYCVVKEQNPPQGAGAKNQIVYVKGAILDTAPDTPEGLEPTGLDDALAETWGLGCADPNFVSDEYAWILFYNQRNFDSLDIIRVHDDRWELEFPAFGVEPEYRFRNRVQSDTRRLGDIICAFFEEGDWRGLADFRFDYKLFETLRDIKAGRPHTMAGYFKRVDERRERAIRERARRRGQLAYGRAPF